MGGRHGYNLWPPGTNGRRLRQRGHGSDCCGYSRRYSPYIHELQAAGYTSLRAIAGGLNERNIPTPRGGIWSAIARLLDRLEA